ncbi:Maf family protein [Halomonas halocynthiae]|uniref:Maf family protein n=1 Tax=Halomonas halocynthiae TaxID=176290 RepID=UPI0004231106|nr:Maf family protein [Halomonas halocynthiae]
MCQLILASGSPWRRQLLNQLQLPYHWTTPDIDEQPYANESPTALVERLALSKAEAVTQDWPAHVIIGSDQVAVFNQEILGKPVDTTAAQAQLARFSGQHVSFFTGLALIDTHNNSRRLCHERYDVVFRQLTHKEITNYIDREQPLDCAGSFRMEGLGITLFERLQGDDPNTLIGLPLIRLCQWLREAGLDPLG